MKPPKRLRKPPKKGFQQKAFDVKKAKTIPRQNGQTTAVPHGENVPIASDMEASHNDTRPTDRPLYDVSSLSTPSTYGPSTSTVQQLRTTTTNKLSSNKRPKRRRVFNKDHNSRQTLFQYRTRRRMVLKITT
jgi:hypothetical protein